MYQQNLNEWMFNVQLSFLGSYESMRITPQKGQAENSWNGSFKLSRSISPLQYPSTVCVLIIALGEQVDFFPWGNRIITEQMIHSCKYKYWRFCTTYDLRNKRDQNEQVLSKCTVVWQQSHHTGTQAPFAKNNSRTPSGTSYFLCFGELFFLPFTPDTVLGFRP